MAVNKLLPFAVADGALVLSDDEWASLPARGSGFQVGEADPAECNKAWRLGLLGTSALGQIVASYGAIDAIDDGDVPGFAADIRVALAMMLSDADYARDTSSTANVLTVTLDPAPVSLNSFRTVYVRVANTNSGPVTIAVNNLGSRNATRRDGLPMQAGDLLAGTIVPLNFDPTLGQFVMGTVGFAEVQRIINGATLWVRPDGNDANDGSANSASSSFQTIAGAIAGANRVATTGIPITIRLGTPGTYAAPGLIVRPGGRFLILGDLNNQAGYIIAGAGTTSNPPIQAYTTDVDIRGVTMSNTGTVADTVAASTFGTLSLTNVTFTSVAGNPFSHVASFPNGNVTFGAGCIIASPMGGWARSTGGTIVLPQVTLTFSGTPAWSSYGIFVTSAGRFQPVGTPTIAGTATGPRYYVDQNSIISSAGGGANFYPGSVAGSFATGGQYV